MAKPINFQTKVILNWEQQLQDLDQLVPTHNKMESQVLTKYEIFHYYNIRLSSVYLQICELQNVGGWTVVWEESQKVPYMYKDDIWVSYDDVRSVKAKVGMNLIFYSV